MHQHEKERASLKDLPLTQAKELALLVELEAGWQNLRREPSRAQATAFDLGTLQTVQKAYDAFRHKLTAYNRRYSPTYIPELLLNAPFRLATWCRAMQELYLKVEHLPGVPCPVALLEKAYRSAERLGARMNTAPPSRTALPDSVHAATQLLGALAQWCDGLAVAAAAGIHKATAVPTRATAAPPP